MFEKKHTNGMLSGLGSCAGQGDEPEQRQELLMPEQIHATGLACQCSQAHKNKNPLLVRHPHNHCGGQREPARCTSLRAAALALFLFVCLFWLYKVYANATGGNDLLGWDTNADGKHPLVGKLKLVSVFNRHGDRSPSDRLPPGDDIAPRAKFFWPNGLNNLTDLGRFRQFRVGLELRRRYETHLDFDANHFLALSSPMIRCRESLEHTLRGLFEIDWTLARGLELVDRYNAAKGTCEALANVTNKQACLQEHLNLPGGSGTPEEYKQIAVDSTTMPMLEYKYLNNCKYRLENPSPVDANLIASPAIAQLKGLEQLRQVIVGRYNTSFSFDALGLWSSIAGEIRLARTSQSIAFGLHYYDWVNQQVREYNETSSPLSLFDLYEFVILLGYRDRIAEGTPSRIQLGPIITSLVTSQQVALGRQPAAGAEPTQATTTSNAYDSLELYRNKRVVIYSSHDSILQLLMHRLGIIRAQPERFEHQFHKWHRSSDFDQLLAGLRMCQFGMSLVFELYEIENPHAASERDPIANSTTLGAESQPFAYLQAALYNEAEPKFKPIEYKRLELGHICKRLFEEQNPSLAPHLVERFYQKDKFPGLDEAQSCPFELFRNVTSKYLISSQELNKLCAKPPAAA